MLLFLGCAHLSEQVHFTSPAPTGNPYTIEIQTDVAAEIRADGEVIGRVDAGEVLRWRAPEPGRVRLEARVVRDGRIVSRERMKVEVGEGLNDAVMALVEQYPTDGSMGYYWPPDDGVWWGTTRELRYDGVVLSPADPEGRSHCVGLTWEVAMLALEAEAGADVVNELTLEQVAELRTDWFVRQLLGAGAAEAVVNWGVGERVGWRDLQPGDFLQLWYPGKSGHSAVFAGYLRKGGRIVGIRYWSTHPALQGIGYREERFGEYGPSKALLYGARLWRREDWVEPGR